MDPGWVMGWGGWLWMGIWIVALLAMVWLITRRPDARPIDEEPLEILRRRFARGELSETDFEQAKRVLELEKEPR
jgi:putative membrane protein